MNCETDCVNERRIQCMEDELKELKRKYSDEHKEFYDRIEDLEKENAVIKNDLDHICKTVDEVNKNLKTLMQQPAKRYETFVVAAITAIITAVIAFILRGALPM